ncbi:MAG: hypothetical protein LBJ32_03070 [Oscillospiraceae bacterium]|jgi:hypothetical protein|nr:hypothetical protein [Oscillospiraceae bacterium]
MKDIRINKNMNFNQLQNKSCSVLIKFFLNFYAKIVKKYLDKINLPDFFENTSTLVYLANQKIDSKELASIIDLLKQLRSVNNEPNVTIQNNTIIRRQILGQLQNELANSESKFSSEKELEVLHSTIFNKKYLTKKINSFINSKKKFELCSYDESKVANNRYQVNNWLGLVIQRYKNAHVNILNKKIIEKFITKKNAFDQILNFKKLIKNKLLCYISEQINEKEFEIQDRIKKLPKKNNIFIDKFKTEKLQNFDKKIEIKKETKLQTKEKISELVQKSELKIKNLKVEKKEKTKIKPKQKSKIISKSKKIKTDSAKKTSLISKIDEINKNNVSKSLNLQETFLQIRKFNDKILENKIKKLRVNTVVNIHALTKKDLFSQNIYKKINKKVNSEIFKNRFFNNFSKTLTRTVLINKKFNNLMISEDYENLTKNIVKNKITKIKAQSQKFLLFRKNKKILHDKKINKKFLDFYQDEKLIKKTELNLFNKKRIFRTKNEKNFFDKKLFSTNSFINKKDRISYNFESYFPENIFENYDNKIKLNKKIYKISNNLKYLNIQTDLLDEIQIKNKKINKTKKNNNNIVKNILSNKDFFNKKLFYTNIFINKKDKILRNFENYFSENIFEKYNNTIKLNKKVSKTSNSLKYLNLQTDLLDETQIKNNKIDQIKIYHEKLRKKVLFNLEKKILFKNKKSYLNPKIISKTQHRNIFLNDFYKFNIPKNKIYFASAVTDQNMYEPTMVYKKKIDDATINKVLDKKIKDREKLNKNFNYENMPEIHVNQKLKNLTEYQYSKNKKILTQNEVEEIVKSYVSSINFEAISNQAVNKIKNDIIIDRQRHGNI